jgi:CelD/BcsL family acetyltransferase involved in cellulose biosynthesis
MSEASRTLSPAEWEDVPAPTVVVETVSPAPRQIWADLFARDPFALASQSPDWADAMCAAQGFRDASVLYRTAAGRTLVLPMLRSTVGGVITIDRSNPPACGVGGVLGIGGVSREETVAVLGDLAARRTFARSVSPGPMQAAAWLGGDRHGATVRSHHVHLLDLQGGWEHVWKQRLNKTSRRGVRYAERHGVTVQLGTGGALLDEFYELTERAVERWSRMQHEPTWLARKRLHARDPLKKFEAIGRSLGDRFQVWVARVDGRTVASSLVALSTTNAHEFRAAMDDTMKGFHATDLLQARAIEAACEAGCRYYYLGESGTGPLGRFKERFGADPVVCPEYRFERLPMERAVNGAKNVVKHAIGFKD